MGDTGSPGEFRAGFAGPLQQWLGASQAPAFDAQRAAFPREVYAGWFEYVDDLAYFLMLQKGALSGAAIRQFYAAEVGGARVAGDARSVNGTSHFYLGGEAVMATPKWQFPERTPGGAVADGAPRAAEAKGPRPRRQRPQGQAPLPADGAASGGAASSGSGGPNSKRQRGRHLGKVKEMGFTKKQAQFLNALIKQTLMTTLMARDMRAAGAGTFFLNADLPEIEAAQEARATCSSEARARGKGHWLAPPHLHIFNEFAGKLLERGLALGQRALAILEEWHVRIWCEQQPHELRGVLRPLRITKCFDQNKRNLHLMLKDVPMPSAPPESDEQPPPSPLTVRALLQRTTEDPPNAMKFLGGLLGGKGSGKELVDKLVGELEGAGVTDSTWAACESSDALEDAIEDDLPRERLVPVLERCPRNAFNFCARCVAAAEAALALQGDAFDEGAEGRLVNSCLLLAKILSASPAGSRTSTERPRGASRGRRHGVLRLSVAGQGGRMLGQRALDMTLRALFHEAPSADEEMRKANSDGVTPALIWADGVGPERESIPKPDKETRSNRQLVLQLLAALLVGGAPAAAAERQAAAEAAEGEAATGAEVAGRRLLVGDPRPLAYLCDPGEPVPLRGELLYSLLSTAFGYDPHGFGVPYAGYIMDSKDEEFAATCLQVLGVLLQDTADAEVPMKSAVAERRPQEEVRAALERARVGEGAQDRAGAGAGAAAPAGGGHVFRDLLRAISSESEVNFLVNGVMTLIGTISEERSTYLPSSMRLPPFLPEVMLIVFHLATCEAFVACACAQGEAPALVEGLLHVASRVPEHLSEETVAMLVGLVVLRLTAYREHPMLPPRRTSPATCQTTCPTSRAPGPTSSRSPP
ncbi:unnamed protein product [Prorocentrum cordatum]|uniref:Uncharacterized protein n=1 Tax=Prorocentrum cordatum TaxID=2364126 RepID=A0ABN9R6R8_9DINO|nr:unnamed protein product [Polarella glacialis]